MKFSAGHILIIILVLFPAALFGQGSGSSEAKRTTGKRSREKNNFAVTRSIRGIVSSSSQGEFTIKRSNGRIISFNVNRKTVVGRGCLKAGQNIRVTYTPNGREATVIRCN